MKKNYSINAYVLCSIISAVIFQFSVSAQGTINKTFTPRTNPAVMSVRGDFALTGNSILTVEGTLSNSSTNSNVDMRYIDMDSDTSTINSSGAELVFRNENNSISECTSIKFAGLYWMGRTDTDDYTYNASNQQSYNLPTTTTSSTLNHGNSLSNPTRSFTVPNDNETGGGILSTSRTLTYRVREAAYNGINYNFVTFDVNGVNYHFGVNSSNNFIVIQGGNLGYRNGTRPFGWGSWTYTYTPANFTNATILPATFTVSGTSVTATFTNPVVVNTTFNYELTSFVRTTNTNLTGDDNSLNPYRNGTGTNTRFAVNYSYSTNSSTGTYNLSKQLDKRRIRIKAPNSTFYQTFTASNSDIYYPTTANQSGIYAAFVDVTNFVRSGGEGMYWVADIAAAKGNGGSAGYFGGWAMVVVYENNKMEYRDISIFDGYAYMQSNSNNTAFTYDIPISGFQARQNGPVNVKIGYIAGEGDRSIEGDFMAIKRRNSTVFDNLSPYGNTSFTNNFFHSAILINNANRIPNYENNTGLDLAVINLTNNNFQYIGNGDSQTTIRVGTNQDLYAIPLFVMAVDAYIPDMSPVNQIASVNGIPYDPVIHQTIEPMDEIEYRLVLQNTGSETINDLEINIALPVTVNFVPGSLNTVYIKPSETIGFPAATFDPNAGVRGSIYWGVMDSFPKPPIMGDTFAILTYKVTATTDCYVLLNPECNPKAAIDGFARGIGAISQTQVDSLPFIFGFQQTGVCIGDPIRDPQVLSIDGTQYILNNCGDDIGLRTYTKCTGINNQTVVPVDSLLPYFPNGSIFTNGYPTYSTQYTSGLPYPSNVNDTLIYYAIPPDGSVECYFKILVTNYTQPQYVSHSYDCKESWVQITSNLGITDEPNYSILSTYRAGVPRNTPVLSNNTGLFTGLRGVDSLVFVVENQACVMTPLGITFPDCNGALPVDFHSFSAIKNGTMVQLDWVAANEIDVKQYEVEHSINGSIYTSIGEVLPQVSQELLKKYRLMHKNPNQGINYYRIKEVDLNGFSSYSVVKIVNFDKDFSVDIYPNPVQNILKIKIGSKDMEKWNYWISNAAMQNMNLLSNQEVLETNRETVLDVSHLTNGVYFLNIVMDNGELVNYKFVINK